MEVPHSVAAAVAGTGECFQSSGVRKAVLLARLTDALQCWWAVWGGCWASVLRFRSGVPD